MKEWKIKQIEKNKKLYKKMINFLAYIRIN